MYKYWAVRQDVISTPNLTYLDLSQLNSNLIKIIFLSIIKQNENSHEEIPTGFIW